MAGTFVSKAGQLANSAEAIDRRAELAADPRRLHWPGPPRRDSPATPWTRYQNTLADQEKARQAQQMAEGFALLVAVVEERSDHCRGGLHCRDGESRLRQAASDRTSCPVLADDDDVDLTRLLRPINDATGILETQALTCSAIPCPDADCAARDLLIEQISFAEGILAAAAGEPVGNSVVGQVVDDNQATDERRVFGGLDVFGVLAELPEAFTSSGLDPEQTLRVASELASMESILTGPSTAARGLLPEWRRISARLALAGLRDALATLRLARRATTSAAWKTAAARLAATLDALMRLERSRALATALPVSDSEVRESAKGQLHSCSGADPRLTRTLFRLRQALSAAAVCSVRSGCTAQAAIDAGRLRAATVVESPALDLGLELFKTLDEEVQISEPAVQDAGARAAPSPVIQVEHSTYRQSEGIRVSLDPVDNRCLAGGGHLALVPIDDVRSRPPATYEDINGSGGTVATATADLMIVPGDRLFFQAPPEGNYAAAVYGAASNGSPLLAAVPLRVDRAEPEVCSGWTGIWATEFGRLVTVERPDGRVSGSYSRTHGVQPGFLFGNANAETLSATWMSEISSGGTRLKLGNNSESFRGSWGLEPGRSDNGGRWSGRCVVGRAR